MSETSWVLQRDLDGHRILVEKVTERTILLEPNIDKSVSWLLDVMEENHG